MNMNQPPLPSMEVSRLATLPVREHPISRIYDLGSSSVSLIELLAALVGGPKQLEIAEAVVSRYQSLVAICQAPTQELEQFQGIGHVTAARIKAACELGHRVTNERAREMPRIRTPSQVAELIMWDMSLLEREEMWVVLLNAKNDLMSIVKVYAGNVNTMIVRPAEIFRDAVRLNAVSIIIAHFHPSGDPTPSPEDVLVTQKIVDAGELLSIDVLDHLVIGKGRFVSMKERHLGFDRSMK